MKTKVVLLFKSESSHACQSWRRLLKPKRININSFKIIIGFFFTPQQFLATKVAISFAYYSPKTMKCTQKPKMDKKFTGIDQSSERASIILHIISTTRSCACAQFTSEKGAEASFCYSGIRASGRGAYVQKVEWGADFTKVIR